jgi:hypothetical protein
VDIERRIAQLYTWLTRRASAEAQRWLGEQMRLIRDNRGGNALAAALGTTPDELGSGALALDARERQAAQDLVAGLDTSGWSLEHAARILLVLASFDGDAAAFAQSLASLLRSGQTDVRIALYRGLPLYPESDRLRALAGDGTASAARDVFEAVAHNNPYPAAHFSEPMWNEMVVQALAIGSRLAPIQGLDERRNPGLARRLVDYAHAGWAARRPPSPELWRCVGPFASEVLFADLVKAFRSGGGDERKAAALALAECPTPDALTVLETAPTLWRDIRNGRLTWDHIGGPASATRRGA